MRLKSVESSYLQSLRYDEVSKVLRVRFTDGAVIDYRNVSSQTYKAIVNADSVGQKFTELVRNKYKFVVKSAANPQDTGEK